MVLTGNIILTRGNGSTYTIRNITDVVYEGVLPYVVENPLPTDDSEQMILNLGGVTRGFIINYIISETNETSFKNMIKWTYNLQGSNAAYYDFTFEDWGINTLLDRKENGVVVKNVRIRQLGGEIYKADVSLTIIYGNILYKSTKKG